jgi:hypothetical protein
VPALQHRVSHADREAVADQLRRAAGDGRLDVDELSERLEAAFAARTYADLVPLTRDLPDGTVPLAARTPARAGRVGGTPGPRWSFAMMSGATRRGRWVVPRRYTATAVMGGVELDLRDAALEDREVIIWAWACMGGIGIRVPADVEVDVSGLALMGGFEDSSRVSAPPGAPVVRVKGFALMGGVDVRRTKAKELPRD